MNKTLELSKYLGLPETEKIISDLDILKLINQRLYKHSFNVVKDELEISQKQFSELLDISEKTIQRYREDDRLSKGVTENLIEIAEIIAFGEYVFGSRKRLLKWLDSNIVALGGNKPLQLLGTHRGRELVNTEIGRLEYGVYA